MRRLLSRSLVASLVALAAGGAAQVHAQDVTEVTLKGAFIFNFARFTDWPSDALPASSGINACVVGDRPVSESLSRAVYGQRLNGRSFQVTTPDAKGTPPTCHLLYVSGVERQQLADLVLRLRDTPILTVSDDDAFIKLGGIIQVFIDNGKMRFRINPRSAKRARLQLSSRLLALAVLVDEDPVSLPPAGPGSQAR